MAVLLLLLSAIGACSGGEQPGLTQEQQAQFKGHMDTAASLVDQRSWAEAVKEYTAAIALDPKSDGAYGNRGLAYTELGEYGQAIADLSRGIELAPDRGGLYYERGRAYRLRGDLDLAISDLSHAIGADRSKTKWRTALFERGLAYKAKGVAAEARADFERILEIDAGFSPEDQDKGLQERVRQELQGLGS